MEFHESVQGYIATECPICGTRLIFRPEQAGGTLQCEMCYHRLKLPKEIQVRRKPKIIQQDIEPYALREETPASLTGDAEKDAPPADALPRGRSDERSLPSPEGPRSRGYGVVPTDDDLRPLRGPSDRTASAGPTSSPKPAERAAAQGAGDPPRRRKEAFAVVCPKCNNRMYARLHQVGQQIGCGDCGYVMVVPQPPAEAPQKVLPKPEPVPLSTEEPPQRPFDDRLMRAVGAPAAPWTPEPPRWTFFSGVVSFLWQGAGPLFWLVLTGGMIISSLVGLLAVSWIGAITPGYSGMGPAMIALCLVAAFGPVVAWTISYAACCFLTVMHDTANGADLITEWPQLAFSERLGDLVRVVYHGGLSLALSYGVGVAAQAIGPVSLTAVTFGGAVLIFPFLTISSLESRRTIWPFSLVVTGSLLTLWWGWLLMYAEIAALSAVWGLTVAFTFDSSPYLTVLWSSPILAAVALISARLFGRLIWRATARDVDDLPRKPTVYERVVRSEE
jgi:DNA-directed RNA polymerase subunit M/transcription elongation factor TFIIS